MRDDAVGTAVVARATGAPEQDRGRWTTVATLGIGTFAIGTDMFVVAGILAGLGADLGVRLGVAGLTVTVFALAYGIGGPLLSALLGARSPRRALIGSLVLFGLFSVMSAQLRSLLELGRLPTVSIQVLPFSAGFHRSLGGQFTILELVDPLADVVYIEGRSGDTYLDNSSDAALFKNLFADTQRVSRSGKVSRRGQRTGPPAGPVQCSSSPRAMPSQ